MKNRILSILTFLPIFLIGQVDSIMINEQPDYITNGAFKKEHNQQKDEAFLYPEVSEKDVVWSRTIWRSIDLRHKINHHFYYPAVSKTSNLNPDNMALIDVVMEALRENANNEINGATVMSNSNTRRLDCFRISYNSTPGNEFRYGTLTPEEVLSIGSELPEQKPYQVQDEFGNVVDSLDENNNIVYKTTAVKEWDRTNVTEWLVKEERFFDKKRSKMQVRIIGLCPVAEDFYDNKTKQTFDRSELFWIYYDDFRDILLNTKVSSITKNNAQERSYLAIFEKRMFDSRITMESNIMNRQISDYMIGLDAVLESERIKEEIFNIEHDLWEY